MHDTGPISPQRYNVLATVCKNAARRSMAIGRVAAITASSSKNSSVDGLN
jgi:hypothetical protein